MIRLLRTGTMAARRNLALSEALLRGGTELIRFQRFPRAALVGAHQDIGREVELDWCRANGVELARRRTGGGAITMDPGILGWELILDRGRFESLGAAAGALCAAAAAGLRGMGLAAEFRPRNDLVVGGRKIGGTGGYFDGGRLLFQGTVLVEPDLAFMASALRLPRGKLSADPARDFAARLTSVVRELGRVVDPVPALAAAFSAVLGALVDSEPSAAEWAAAEAVFAEDIGRDGFVMGADMASVAGAADRSATRATPAGVVTATLRHRAGVIVQARVDGDFFLTPPRALPDLEGALAGVALCEAGTRARDLLAGAVMLGGDVVVIAETIAGAAG